MPSLRALLVTDLVDSTAITQRIGDAASAALWARHDRAARDLWPRWRGREIDRSDGFFLLFDSPADALGCALAYHRLLATLSSAETGPLVARAGVHHGELHLRENPAADVARGAKVVEADGLAKAVAARVMSVARGGQTLLSANAADALQAADGGNVAEGITLRSHGWWWMKGTAEPLELFEAGDAACRFEPPPDSEKVHRVVRLGELWQPARRIAHNLPAEVDAFIGRGEALRTLADHLNAGSRLVTVHGMGGGGKTRLALHHGWRWLGEFAAGVWFCDLSAARDADGVVRAVAQGLQVPLGRGDPNAQIAQAIAGRGRCLVILDNAEQVAEALAKALWSWLQRAAQARFIVTSREVLRLPGEQVMPLPALNASEGAALFAERAAAAGALPRTDEAERRAIAALVDLLEGLPLAIELAAARARTLAPAELLARMDERFKLLTGGLAASPGRPPRHATLRAALDWSWQLLTLPERDALAQLSVFDGGATLAAIEATLESGTRGDAAELIDVLQSLVEKSFVRRDGDDRFALPASVREYAAEGLATPGRFPGSGPAALRAAERRHWQFFATLGAEGAVRDGCADLPNLIGATRRAVDAADAEAASRLVMSAWAALRQRGPFSLGRELAEQVLRLPQLNAQQRARAQRTLGGALHASGQSAEALQHFVSALQDARDAGDGPLETLVRAYLGDQLAAAGQEIEGRAELALALSGARRFADLSLEAQVLTYLGDADQRIGRLDSAADHYEQALRVARAVGDRRREGGILGNLGTVRHQQGRWTEARALYGSALVATGVSGDRQWEANTSSNLGLLLQQLGEPGPAREALESALRAARELGHRRLECIALSNLGQVAETLNDDERACEHFEQAAAIAHELGDRLSEGQVSGYLAALHARHGRLDLARELFEAGAQALATAPGQPSLGVLLCDRAECESRAGDRAAAARLRDTAHAIARDINAEPGSELAERLLRLDRSMRKEG